METPVHFDSSSIPPEIKEIGIGKEITLQKTVGDTVLVKDRATGLIYPLEIVRENDEYVYVGLIGR